MTTKIWFNDSPFDGAKLIGWDPSPAYVRRIMLTFMLGSVLAMLVIWLSVPEQTARLIGPALLGLLAAVAYGVQATGRVRASVLLLAGGAWLVATWIAVQQGGVRTPILIAYPLLVMSAGWLFGQRAAAVAGVASVLAIGAMVVGEELGFLPMPQYTPALVQGVIQIAVVIVALFMINSRLRAYIGRLEELNQAGRELAHRTQQLEAAQTQLGIAIESTRMLFWQYDLVKDDLQYDDASLAWLGTFAGEPPHTLAGWLEQVHPQDRAPFMAEFAKAAKPGGHAFELDYRLADTSGGWIWHHTRGTVVKRDAQGRALFASGGSINISGRKLAEEKLRRSESLLQTIINSAPVRVFWEDRDLRYMGCNALFAKDAGVADPALLVGQLDKDLVWKDQAELYGADDRRAIDSGVARYSYDEPQTTPSGQQIWCRTSKVPLRGEDDAIIGVLGLYEDITERKNNEDRLRQMALVLENSSEGMLMTDADNHIVDINPAFSRLTGYSRDDAVGKTPAMLRSGRQSADFYKAMWASLNTTGKWQGEIWNRGKDGHFIAEWLTINTLYDADGAVHRRVALFSDITEKKKADEQIWTHANFDLLTHLPNRRMYQDRMLQEIKKVQRSGRKLALFFLDLDHFKEVNDTLGHDKGDILLVEAAQRIVGCVRETDTVARVGGDEFTVILTGADEPDSVERVARQIVQALALPFAIGDAQAQVSVSVGIAMYPLNATDPQELMTKADQAMYAAKESGRNTYRYYLNTKT
jgi:diguanylate cyclase (GGDEF)-like protein/PAS domain S-box-containing protein